LLSRWRVWRYLPGFLKNVPLEASLVQPGAFEPAGILWRIATAVGEAFGLIWGDIDLLKARGLGGHLTGYEGYYGSDQRSADLVALAESRVQGKRPTETWEQFETRMAEFGADVALWGTKDGMKAELERVGVLVVSITEMNDDPDRWIVRTHAALEETPDTDRSKIYSAAGQPAQPPGQRDCRIYSGETEFHTFKVVLGGIGGVEWSAAEIVAVVKACKPAYTRGLVRMPDSNYYTEVL
jgi:hypothetical protein